MNYKEYEYSFEVNDLKPIIDFCINNNYTYEGENQQTRVIYKDKNKKFMFRTTENNNNGVVKVANTTVTIGTTPGTPLPHTGGPGAAPFAAAGSVLVAIAFAVLIRRRGRA